MSQNLTSSKTYSHDAPPISKDEFVALRDYLREHTGIALAEIKKNLVRTRLRNRLRTVGCSTFGDYFNLLEKSGPDGNEMQEFVNCITTNKTDFFREQHHFDYLKDVALPQIIKSREKGGERVIRVWSAGCSRGHEPYSLAITLADFFADKPDWSVRILASDIDTDCLQTAINGVYQSSELTGLAKETKHKHFLRGVDESEGMVKVRDSIAKMITFRNINLASNPWPIRTKFDFVFCRNVIIYFDQDFQNQLLKRFIGTLQPHGLLFLGHSESITWMPELTSLGQTIYRPSANVSDPSRLRKIKRIVAGETIASDEPIEISTLLGSCVAVCLHDPIAGVGGMNHVLFANDGQVNHKSSQSISTGSAQGAMEALLKELVELGARPSRMVAKLFGGAELFDELRSSFGAGIENIRAVTSQLKARGIPIVEKRVGGNEPVRISMRPDTGQVFVEKQGNSEPRPNAMEASNA